MLTLAVAGAVGYLQRCIYCVFEREEGSGEGGRIRVEGELGLEAAAQRTGMSDSPTLHNTLCAPC